MSDSIPEEAANRPAGLFQLRDPYGLDCEAESRWPEPHPVDHIDAPWWGDWLDENGNPYVTPGGEVPYLDVPSGELPGMWDRTDFIDDGPAEKPWLRQATKRHGGDR